MTRLAYFQPFSGASGDMALGALVDAGLPLERLEEGLRLLGVGGWKLRGRKELRGAFQTTRLEVLLDLPAGREGAEGGHGRDPGDRQQHDPAHQPREAHHHDHARGHSHAEAHPHDDAHSNAREHEHGHGRGSAYGREHEHSHGHWHARETPKHPAHGAHSAHGARPIEGAGSEGPGGSRGLAEILKLIASSALPDPVKDSSSRVFRRLGEAEARVHGIPVGEVHFHEVGALDSIVDIVGTCLGLHLLGVEEVRSAPITVGTGFVDIAHGRAPLPAPATIELLRGFPIEQRESGFELTTPTGAALLTTLAGSFGPMPPLRVTAVGYGAGNDRPGPLPNALRVILGDLAANCPAAASPGGELAAAAPAAAPSAGDRVLVLETNIDDMSPEWAGNLMDRLFEAGALDVSLAPIHMKKSRPAHELKVIAPLAAEAEVVRTVFRESTTFGLRRTEVDRIVLERELRPIETPWGVVRVKVGRLGGEAVTASPEYEDLRAAAAKAGLPLKEVHAKVMEIFRARREG